MALNINHYLAPDRFQAQKTEALLVAALCNDPGGSGGSGAFVADGSTRITPVTPILLNQITGNETALTLNYETYKTAGNDTGLLINQTDTNSPGTSKLLDLQVGGTSKCSVTSEGSVLFPVANTVTLSGPGVGNWYGTLGLFGGGGSQVTLNAAGLNLGHTHALSWGNDTKLARDAANTLAQRNGVNAQTYNIYNTDDGAGNHERGHIGWNDTADTFVIGTEAAGTGVVRDIQIKIGADRVFGVDTTLFNTSVGAKALGSSSLTGTYNTASGYQSLRSNIGGSFNTASGSNSLYSNTTGNYNVASGYQSLRHNATGSFNTASGLNSLFYNITGSHNVASGYNSLYSNTTGSYNVASGYQSLINNTTGSHNVASGYQAGRFQADGATALTVANYSIFIGRETRGVNSATNQIVIGNTAIGLGSNTVVLGDDSIVTTALKGNVGIGTTAPGAALEVAPTWNNVATTFTGIKADVTDTASAAGSNLMDLQVGGASKFNVNNLGQATITSDSLYADLASPSINAGIKFVQLGGRLTSNSYTRLAWAGSSAQEYGIHVNNFIGLAPGASNSNLVPDVFVARDAANTLAQRNGVNAQTFNIYNTDDGSGNAEWLSLGFSSNDAIIQVAKSGTGVDRPLFLRGQTLFLGGAAGSNHWRISTAGHFLAQADNTYDIGAASATRPRNGYFSGTLDISQGTLTDDAQALNITSTWNDAVDTFTLIKADVTDTASAAGSKLMDLQVGGVSKLSVDNAGRLAANELGFTNGGLAKIVHNGAAGNVGELNFHNHDSGTGDSMLNVGNYSVSVPLLEITDGAATSPALVTLRAAAATLQLGTDHATVATGQTIKAHDVVTGTGADLTLSGGIGSVADGDVILSGNVQASGGLTLPAGSPSQPSLVIGATTNNGFYTSGSTLAYAINGSSRLTLDSSGAFWLRTDASNIAFGSSADLRLYRAAAATLQLGTDHATVATGQTIKAHDVATGTGADLTLSGGTGSVADGDVVLQPTSGNVGIGTTTPATTLDVVGSIAATGTVKTTPTTVGALPAAATAGAGARTFVTDAANTLSSHHGQTVSGGGANFSPVYSDGTNWLAG